MRQLIILDRDGVINFDSKEYIKSPDEWQPIPGSLEAIATLNQHGYTVVIATNQSGIARQLYDEVMLEKIHQKMHLFLEKVGGKIDRIFYCPHQTQDNCTCRKPKPGLLQQIADFYQVSLANVPFVGDSWRDIQAAQAINAIPILVLSGNGEKTYQQYSQHLQNMRCYADLSACVQAMVNRS